MMRRVFPSVSYVRRTGCVRAGDNGLVLEGGSLQHKHSHQGRVGEEKQTPKE